MTRRVTPDFGSIDTWRDVVKNNSRIHKALFQVETDSIWLPQILTDLGFFPSNSEVRRNRPDLWREDDRLFIPVSLSWALIDIFRCSSL